ncbi:MULTISPECIES: hypothetical protein [Bacillus cereus group]|uniref:Uncharacterized protein n=1 Tax=Bacillus proteolyticus TaxID=2026192 RepID=A0AA44KQV1_9BACI|nr:hypothetical protein [Bacillus cereus group sp. N8]MBJ8105588.1 hypothetical protein [Bacillus cereus group sp. N8]OJE35357.1 hypothetical protein BAQ49_17825 [Bacillus proteolyticus]PGV66622.1 hypothetical protein COD94_05015 [Bacillus cereus]
MTYLTTILSIAGIVIMSLARINFRIRAFVNKPAWGGFTLPLVLIGFISFCAGMILAFVNHQL